LEENEARNPNKVLKIRRALEDWDLVAVYPRARQKPSELEAAVVHIFKFEGNRIVELWDMSQAVPEDSPKKTACFDRQRINAILHRRLHACECAAVASRGITIFAHVHDDLTEPGSSSMMASRCCVADRILRGDKLLGRSEKKIRIAELLPLSIRSRTRPDLAK
jgi:hypothetical protein